MTINKQQITKRQIKGLTIVGLNQVRQITPLLFKVKSQSTDNWYDVKYEFIPRNNWACTCRDYTIRKIYCKHIEAVHFYKDKPKEFINYSNVDELETSLEFTCKCGSKNFRKNGIRKNKGCEIQRYKCLECGKRFCDNIGLRSKASAKAITASLDLYFNGLSLRQVRRHLLQFYGIDITHVAIYKWIHKFLVW